MWCPWARRDWPEQHCASRSQQRFIAKWSALLPPSSTSRAAFGWQSHTRARAQSHTLAVARAATPHRHPIQSHARTRAHTHRRTCSFTMLLHCSMHMPSASGTPIAPEMIAFRNGEIGRRRPSCWYCIPLRCRRLARRTAERHAARSQNTRASSWERKSLACCAQTNNDHGAIDSTWTQHDVSGRRSRRGTPRTHGARCSCLNGDNGGLSALALAFCGAADAQLTSYAHWVRHVDCAWPAESTKAPGLLRQVWVSDDGLLTL